MATKKGSSSSDFFGTTTHYDAHGKKIGTTSTSLFGGATHYDAKGKKIGSSSPNLFGGETIYDEHHHKIGSTSPGFFGTNFYDEKGHKVDSTASVFGSTTNYSDLSNRYENMYEAEHRMDAIHHAEDADQANKAVRPMDSYNASPPSSSSSGFDTFCTFLGAAFCVVVVIFLLSCIFR